MKTPSFKKLAVITALVCSFAFAGWSVLRDFESEPYTSGLKVEKVVIETRAGKRHVFKLEVAETPIDIEIGLMHRTSMPADRGIIFLMGKEPRATSFWMKNTLIPLDMIFIGPRGDIINIHHNAAPESLSSVPSGGPVTAVIEINGGLSKELEITPGDRVIHSYFE